MYLLRVLEASGPKAVPLGQNSSARSESPLWRFEGKPHSLPLPHSGGTWHSWAAPRRSGLCSCGHVAFLLLSMSNCHLLPSYQEDPVMAFKAHLGRPPTPKSLIRSHLQSLCTQGSTRRSQGLEPYIFGGPSAYHAAVSGAHSLARLPCIGRALLWRAACRTARGSSTKVPPTPWALGQPSLPASQQLVWGCPRCCAVQWGPPRVLRARWPTQPVCRLCVLK